MKIYKYISIILLAFSTLFFVQCTDSYYEYNKTGVDDEEGERDAYFLRQHMTNMQNWIIPSPAHANQFTELLLGGTYGGYFADVNPGFNNRNFSTYGPESGWTAATFNDAYKEVIGSYYQVQNLTEDPIYLSVAKVLKVMSLSRMTDIYGPIPYSKLGKSGALNAGYDSQEQVYEEMIKELNEAIETMSVDTEHKFSPKADRYYGGQTIKWVKLANSIKLRLAIRMAKVKPDLAKATAEAVMTDPVGPILSNQDNAILLLISGQSNPYKVGMEEWGDGGDTRISADITSYMNGYRDPRRAKYFDAAFANNQYTGFRSGVTIPSPQTIGQQYSNMSKDMRAESSMRIMCATEVAFLRAEGALRGWSGMGGTAKELYEEGITLSFDHWGVAGAPAYIADNTSRPSQYSDPLGRFTYSGAISDAKIAWDDSDTSITGANFERIITQKWIANFPNGIEAWTEFRRTGYPKLMPVVTNNSSVVSTEKMARRLSFPQSEYTGNLTNVQEAISVYLGGPDNMATDLWWAR